MVSLQCGLYSDYLDCLFEKMLVHKCHKQMVSPQCGRGDGWSGEVVLRRFFRKYHKPMISLQCGLFGTFQVSVHENKV